MKKTKHPQNTTLRLEREVLRALGGLELAQIDGGRMVDTAASKQDVCCA